jgi:GT2 family glycosyltransferase
MPAPRLSLVVCTRNRAASLESTLRSIEDADAASAGAEVIVVDNGSSDGTRSLVQARPGFRYVCEPVPGLSRARNAGIRAARGGIVAFTDDDCLLGGDYFEAVAGAFAGSRVSYCGGRILRWNADDAEYGFIVENQRRELPAGAFLFPGQIQGANMAFRREVFAAAGLFDETFGAGTRWRCEDIAFCQRVALGGFAGALVPEIVVYHAHGRKPGAAIREHVRLDAYARGAYYAEFALRGDRRHRSALARSTLGLLKARRSSWRELAGALDFTTRRLRDRELVVGHG